MTNPELQFQAARVGGPDLRVVIATLSLLCALPAQAQAPESGAAGVDPVAPEAIGPVVSCVVCHGAEGEGKVSLGAPRIGGMADWYLSRQLRHFRNGVRGSAEEDVFGMQMRAMALAVENTEVLDELARYFSSLAPPAAPDTVTGDVERGKQLYAVCAACHGSEGLGNKELNAPALTGQHDWYLVRQMENYRQGLRGGQAEDVYGQQMVPIVKSLPDQQAINDVVAYINKF